MPRSHSWREAPDAVPETKSLDTSWEKEFGLVQGVQSGSLVFLSGQLALDENGMIVGKGSLDTQMRQAYANVAKALQLFNRP
jgi:enamine deaminase RidA (YjgF/YER057c/UK114 family)